MSIKDKFMDMMKISDVDDSEEFDEEFDGYEEGYDEELEEEDFEEVEEEEEEKPAGLPPLPRRWRQRRGRDVHHALYPGLAGRPGLLQRGYPLRLRLRLESGPGRGDAPDRNQQGQRG